MTSLASWQPLPQGEDQFPLEYIRSRRALVLKKEGDELTLGMVDDSSPARLHISHQLPGKKLTFVTLDPKELAIFLADSHGLTGEETKHGQDNSLDLASLEGDAPIINLVNSIIMEALKKEASDIHIEAFPQKAWVRLRLDGVLKRVREIPREHFNAFSSRVKIMANLNIMEKRLPQDGRITVRIEDETVDLRVSVVPIAGEGESLVLRLLNRGSGLISLDDMGFSPDQTASLLRLIDHPHGLILVTGPTGSGKTTTLNALLSRFDVEEKKIITIEDPIEYLMEGIGQIQTNNDIGLTFPALLRRVLRQDPNIIMVGEIRDRETAELAVRAALTGHLVLSTLHTNDSFSAVTRLRDMGVEPFLLAAVLKGVLAQRLVRTLCPHCSRERTIRPEETEIFKRNGVAVPEFLREAVGCDECSQSGFRGRTAVGEFFNSDETVEEAISRSANVGELRHILGEGNFEPLLVSGLRLAATGHTTLKEVEGAVYF